MSRRQNGYFASAGGGSPTILGGDVTGPSTSNTVVAIQNIPVGSTAPSVGDTLIFDGTSYEPGTIAGGTSYMVMVFNANGDLDTFPVDQPFDCQRPALIASEFTVGQATLRVDSDGSGNVAATVYKRTSPGSRVAIGTVTIAQGIGDNSLTAITLLGTQANRTVAVGDRVEVDLEDAMIPSLISSQDLCIALRFEVLP